MTTNKNERSRPLTFHMHATGTPGVWEVWYTTPGNERGYNGALHDAFSWEAAVAAQTRRAAIYGWEIAGFEDRTHVWEASWGRRTWLDREIAAAAIERRETSIPGFVDVWAYAISEQGERWPLFSASGSKATREAVAALLGIPVRYVTDRTIPR